MMADPQKLKQQIFRDIEAGQYETAIRKLEKCTKKSPSDADFWFLHGAVQGQLGNYDRSIASLKRSLTLNPEHLDSYANLGLACIKGGDLEQAINTYRVLIGKSPSYPGAYFHLGYASLLSGDIESALLNFRTAVRLFPGDIDGYIYLAKSLMTMGTPREALETVQAGLAHEPDRQELLLLGASIFMELGRLDEADEFLERVLSADPGCVEALVGKALAFENRGDFNNARDLILPLVDSGEKNVDLGVAFARISRHFNMREDAVGYIEGLLDHGPELDADSAGTLNYQLGKLKDALGHYDAAFSHFSKSNASRSHVFDPERYSKEMAELRLVYTREFFSRAPALGVPDVVPVFIVGMPRSGTTLAEQILASHPEVFGAGELPDIDDITRNIAEIVPGKLGYPRCMKLAAADVLLAQRDSYLEKLAEMSSGARWVTDKMPHNFEHLGLISILFPNARIVHCVRNPLDTCVSIFFNDFNAGHGYATDLGLLGGHYKEYLGTMEHWRSVLPVPIFDLKYEEVIFDQETNSRRLLEFCGLEWSPECLEFYKSKRIVSTFSYDQVRKPIYNGSVERWRKYENHLGPLLEVLET